MGRPGKGCVSGPLCGFHTLAGALSGRQSDLYLSALKVTPQSPGTPCCLLGSPLLVTQPLFGDGRPFVLPGALTSREDTSDAASGRVILRARWPLPHGGPQPFCSRMFLGPLLSNSPPPVFLKLLLFCPCRDLQLHLPTFLLHFAAVSASPVTPTVPCSGVPPSPCVF